jgi:diaminohydroxyphosphoribosylaminopyrimidine deaminase / 5-amino-6-(5-phosphoribosylamino)uracil reductase
VDDAVWRDMLDGAGADESQEVGRESVLARAFAPLVVAKRTNVPLVVAQLGQSLDGRIATPNGSSRGINGPSAMAHLHRLRALVDAVVVGAGTARTDDPRLTVRHCEGESPARVVIDPRGTVSPDAKVWDHQDGARRLVFGGSDLLGSGVERIGTPSGVLSPSWLLEQLRARGFSRVLIEGGGKTVSSFIASEAADYLHLLLGPVFLGAGLSGLNLPCLDDVEDAYRPEVLVHQFDQGDVLVACRMRPQGGAAKRSV